MSAGPIPWTAMDAWADRHQLDQDSALLLISVLRILDNEHADRAAAKREAKETRGPT